MRTNYSVSRLTSGMIMRLAILGTGNMAQTLARRLSETGHEVTFGSRDPASKEGLDAPVASLAGRGGRERGGDQRHARVGVP